MSPEPHVIVEIVVGERRISRTTTELVELIERALATVEGVVIEPGVDYSKRVVCLSLDLGERTLVLSMPELINLVQAAFRVIATPSEESIRQLSQVFESILGAGFALTENAPLPEFTPLIVVDPKKPSMA